MIRRPPRSTLLTHSFPTRRSSDLFRLSFTRQMPDRQQQEGTDGGEVAYNLLRAGVAQAMPHLENAEGAALHAWRSEEHTSELQSLMRISYAVFCLKKKNTKNLS